MVIPPYGVAFRCQELLPHRMSSQKKVLDLPAVYRGREQTFIKHWILRHYLERVARNILWARQEFVFVDGFSGPWASSASGYSDTSFGIAMQILRKVRDELKAQGRTRNVRCVFVEKGAAAFERLSLEVDNARDIEAQAIRGRFEDRIDDVLKSVGSAFALISVDPKGWSFDLQKLAPLLRIPQTEVIVNFMYEHLNRFLEDPREKIRRSFVLPFGVSDWDERLDSLRKSGLSREELVLELFRSQLKSVGNFKYVLKARIQRSTADRSHFYIFYGTRSVKGLVEFRNVERSAMEAEESSRIIARQDKRVERGRQPELFSATELTPPRSLSDLRQPEMELAKRYILSRLSVKRVWPYLELLAELLEKFSMTEVELKNSLVALRKIRKLDFRGMKPRQRKPSGDVTIVLVD